MINWEISNKAIVLAELNEFPTVEYLLSRVSEEEIFAYYLGFWPDTLDRVCYCSPLRVDNNPTCMFYRGNNNRLYFRDFGYSYGGLSRLDCFELVSYIHKISFKESLFIIAYDLKVWEKTKSISQFKGEIIDRPTVEVKYKKKDWSKVDLDFWSKYGINPSTLKLFNVEAAEFIWVRYSNEQQFIPKFYYDDKILLYVYNFKKNQYQKIYLPYVNRKEDKWWSNCHGGIIQGWEQLTYYSEDLIITKALKDVMWFYQLGYDSIAPQSENTFIDERVMEELKSKYKRIFVNFDNDEAGRKFCELFVEKFPFVIPLFVPNRFEGSKDFTDLSKNIGVDNAIKVARELIDNS